MGHNAFLIITTTIMFLGGIIWTKNDRCNLAVKVLLFVLGIWGILVTLTTFGYIIKG